MSFGGKVVIVTGSSSGIGAEIARLYSQQGALVTVTGRNTAALDQVKATCVEANGGKPDNVLIVAGELGDVGVQKKLVDETVAKFGKLDILVNNAALAFFTPFGDMSMEQYDEMSNVNIRALFNLSQLALPHLKQTKGNIVNTSSVAGSRVGSMGTAAYCMSKGAVDHLTRAMAFELAKYDVRVNAIAPGSVATNLARSVGPKEQGDALQKQFEEMHPLKGPILTTDCAEAVLFLSSDKACRTTGQILGVDAGLIQKGMP